MENLAIRQIAIVTIEALTPAAFAQFGVILSPEGRERLPINTYGDKLDLYREGFETDRSIEWFIARFRSRDLKPLFLERHRQLTQTFIPLSGAAFVMFVAPSDAARANGMPDVESMRAFRVPGEVAVQLHRSTWHENPFPLQAEQTLLVTSHAALTSGHQQTLDAAQMQLPLDLERVWFKDAAFDVQLNMV